VNWLTTASCFSLSSVPALVSTCTRTYALSPSAWPRLGAVGHPTHCELLGVAPSDQMQLSDHFGVLADLCYWGDFTTPQVGHNPGGLGLPSGSSFSPAPRRPEPGRAVATPLAMGRGMTHKRAP
jgi:hypothetical protein